MAEFVLVSGGGIDRPAVLKTIRIVTGAPLGELRDALNEGGRVFGVKLFDNEHEEHAELVRRLLPLLESEQGLSSFLLEEGQTLQNSQPEKPSYILNVLDAWDAGEYD